MSAIVPVTGCNNSQPHNTAPDTGTTAAARSLEKPTPLAPLASPLAHWVVISSNWQTTRVVFTAGRMPLNWARRKNSSKPRCTITPRAKVNHQPPRPTTSKPKAPAP